MNKREPFLIMDCVGSAKMVLNEAAGNGKITFRGKFQEADRSNKNKREYTKEILDKNVKALMETVNARGLYGELDHPTDSIVHLANASHIVTKLWWEANILMGEGEVLPTPSGRVLQALIERGGRVGISSRGVGNGTVNSEGVLVIGESFKLITFDAVADPSTFDAYQEKITGKRETYEAEPSSHPVPVMAPKYEMLNPDLVIGYVEAAVEHGLHQIKGRI